MLDIIDKLRQTCRKYNVRCPELINEGRNFISKEDSITKALEVVNNYYGIEIDKTNSIFPVTIMITILLKNVKLCL